MNRIGLIAGNGRFPFLVADEVRKSGDQVVAIALNEETDPALEQHVDALTWIPLGQLQKMIDYFHAEKVTSAMMVGQVKHAHLFAALQLDWRAVKLLGKLINKKTDTILGAVAQEFENEGIALLPSHKYLTHLLPRPGIISGPKLSKEERADVEFGHAVAKHVAGMDIGQTVVVKDKAVIAVEAMEGTDQCIRRAATLGRENIIVVKVAKPSQDWRFDLPVIGPRTIATLVETKARAIAVEAGATLLLDREQLLADAKQHDITIIAL